METDLLEMKFRTFSDALRNEKPALGLLKFDPSLFAYFFFVDRVGGKFKVYAYQDMILNDKASRICVCIARQTGKSTMAGLLAFHTAFFKEGSTVMVVSATKPQALELIYKLKVMLKGSKVTNWRHVMPQGKESKSEIVLNSVDKKTESRIISVPATDAARGYSPDLVIVDEAAFIENGDYIFNQVIEPSVQATKGRIILLSTPNGQQGFFYTCFNSKYWSSYQFGWDVCPTNSKDEMEEKRERMTLEEFQAEYEAKFTATKDAYFSSKDVVRASSKGLNSSPPVEGRRYSIGVDFGKINDNCVIHVGHVENPSDPVNEQRVVMDQRIVKPLGTDYGQIIGELNALSLRWNHPQFVLDATGVGEAPSDMLSNEGIRVEPVKFSIKSKADFFSNLKILLEQGRIDILDEAETKKQLQEFRYEYTPSGQIKLHHPDGGHDDECDALALMAWGLINIRRGAGAQIIKPQKDTKVATGSLKTHVCSKCGEYFKAEGEKHFEEGRLCSMCE